MIDLLSGGIWLFVLFCTLSAALCGYFWLEARKIGRTATRLRENNGAGNVVFFSGQRAEPEELLSGESEACQDWETPLEEIDENQERKSDAQIVARSIMILHQEAGNAAETTEQMRKDLEHMTHRLEEMETAPQEQLGGEMYEEMMRARAAVQDMKSKLEEVSSGRPVEDAEQLGKGMNSLGSEMANTGSVVESMRNDLDEMLSRFRQFNNSQADGLSEIDQTER